MPRAGLTRETIVDAAFELLADGGLDAITARALADRLGVRAGALYYHLTDMDALRDEMGTRITRRMLDSGLGAQDAHADWQEMLRRGAHHIRATLLDYRDGARIVAGSYLLDDEALRSLEHPLRVLVDAGFEPVDAQRALSTLNAFVMGFVVEEQQRLAEAAGGRRFSADARRARLDPDEQPLSTAVSAEVADLPEAAFDWGVDALLAGIAARLDQRAEEAEAEGREARPASRAEV